MCVCALVSDIANDGRSYLQISHYRNPSMEIHAKLSKQYEHYWELTPPADSSYWCHSFSPHHLPPWPWPCPRFEAMSWARRTQQWWRALWVRRISPNLLLPIDHEKLHLCYFFGWFKVEEWQRKVGKERCKIIGGFQKWSETKSRQLNNLDQRNKVRWMIYRVVERAVHVRK